MTLTEEQYVRFATERLDAVRNFRASINALGYTRQSQLLEHVIDQIEADQRIINMKQTIKEETAKREHDAWIERHTRDMNGDW